MSGVPIKVVSRSFSKNPILRRELQAEFPSAAFNEDGETFEGGALVSFLDGAAGAVVSLETIDGALLDSLPDLRIIAKYGVGLDNLDLGAMEERGVALGWTGGVNKRGVAEMTLGFMLGLNRNLYGAGVSMRAGNWLKDGGRDLSSCTVGIIGAGHVGKEVAALLRPMGCQILVNDIIEQADYYRSQGLTEAGKDEIYAAADVLTLHIPLTDLTQGLIDTGVLDRMKPDAYLINAARGGVVNQADLKRALIENQIGGAALDVFELEPCPDRDLLALPNLWATPHIGGSSAQSVLAMGRSSIYHLSNFFK